MPTQPWIWVESYKTTTTCSMCMRQIEPNERRVFNRFSKRPACASCGRNTIGVAEDCSPPSVTKFDRSGKSSTPVGESSILIAILEELKALRSAVEKLHGVSLLPDEPEEDEEPEPVEESKPEPKRMTGAEFKATEAYAAIQARMAAAKDAKVAKQ